MSFQLEVDFWFAENNDEIASEVASSGLPALMAKLHGMKPFPAAARELMSIMARDDHDRAEVVKVIESDPGLATSVLRAINSAAYSLRRECTSVSHAVVLLGSRSIGELASGLAVLRQFSGLGPHGAAIRDHSLLVAAMCRRLAQLVPSLAKVDVFTCGLLHDIGKLFQLQVDQGSYDAMLNRVAGCFDSVHQLERELLGYDHAVLAAHVMSDWSIPDPLPKVVAWHHQPERAYYEGGVVGDLVAVVRLANRLAYEQLMPDNEILRAAVAAEGEAQHLGLTSAQLDEAWQDLCDISSNY